MKKLAKIKLTQVNKEELEKRKMAALKGGSSCACDCTMRQAVTRAMWSGK